MLESLFETQRNMAQAVSLDFKRYLYDQIDWGARALAVVGARGTGKTTLLLQHYRENFTSPEECLYLLGDDLEVASLGLTTIADEFYRLGGAVLIIDEIHKYPNWSQELKNIYDQLPQLKLIISGSATLNITRGKYDLSRRMVTYRLHGLSFREFLSLETGLEPKPWELANLIAEHTQIATEMVDQLATGELKVLPLFKNYLKYGYYPFYLEGVTTYFNKLDNVLDKVLYEDIPSVFGTKAGSVPALQKLIHLIATSSPFTVDISSMAGNIGVSRETIYTYIDYLEQADILLGLKAAARGSKAVRKPEKLYLSNPNLYTLVNREKVTDETRGAMRESFALTQLTTQHEVTLPKQGDFWVDDRLTFEVGGRGKGPGQVKHADRAGYVLADDIEVGYNQRLPLWLVGFLY